MASNKSYINKTGHNELVEHHIAQTHTHLDAALEAIMVDAGLNPAGNVARHAQTVEGAKAAAGINQLIDDAMKATGVAKDGNISVDDVIKINAWIRADAGRLADFVRLHGDDENGEATGFHLIQNDGGTTQFRGQNFVNTVMDGIFHIGFAIENGRLLNEDGDANATLVDVANWLNAMYLGNNNVNGTNGNDVLTSGQSSAIFSNFDNEVFRAGNGNDTVNAGAGNDTAYGGNGNDTLNGEDGNDKLYGEDGNDTLNGGAGNDELEGGAGNDILSGGTGNDELEGGAGNDMLNGGTGNDRLNGGSGSDVLNGGAGADRIDLGNDSARDTIVFRLGDSGKSGEQIDEVKNFHHGEDKIDLSSFTGMHFAGATFSATGGAEVIYKNGDMMIDADGDGKVDITVHFEGHANLSATDFIFA
jgi:Ca2+-binding RTX toxin-like protein